MLQMNIKNGDYDYGTLDLEALRKVEVNDFDAMKIILFPEQVVDFKKFIYHYDWKNRDLTIKVPFSVPNTMIEYQIDHFVMWGVITELKIDYKPGAIVDYFNTEAGYCSPVLNCYACDYNSGLNDVSGSCLYCPIWDSKNDTYNYMCESSRPAIRGDKDNYYKWFHTHEVDEDVLAEFAMKMQYERWEIHVDFSEFLISKTIIKKAYEKELIVINPRSIIVNGQIIQETNKNLYTNMAMHSRLEKVKEAFLYLKLCGQADKYTELCKYIMENL